MECIPWGNWEQEEDVVDIYCDDESSRRFEHHGRRAKVVQFHRPTALKVFESHLGEMSKGRVPSMWSGWPVEDVWGVGYGPMSAQAHVAVSRAVNRPNYVSPELDDAARRALVEEEKAKVSPGRRRRQVLVVMNADGTEWHEGDSRLGRYSKYRLRCDFCHLDKQYQSEPVQVFLDRLFEAGKSEVSLSALAAILDK